MKCVNKLVMILLTSILASGIKVAAYERDFDGTYNEREATIINNTSEDLLLIGVYNNQIICSKKIISEEKNISEKTLPAKQSVIIKEDCCKYLGGDIPLIFGQKNTIVQVTIKPATEKPYLIKQLVIMADQLFEDKQLIIQPKNIFAKFPRLMDLCVNVLRKEGISIDTSDCELPDEIKELLK